MESADQVESTGPIYSPLKYHLEFKKILVCIIILYTHQHAFHKDYESSQTSAITLPNWPHNYSNSLPKKK